MSKAIISIATAAAFLGAPVAAIAADASSVTVGSKIGAIGSARSGANVEDDNNALAGNLIVPILAAGAIVGGIVAIASDDNGGNDTPAS